MPRIIGALRFVEDRIVEPTAGGKQFTPFRSQTLTIEEDTGPDVRPTMLQVRVGKDFGTVPPVGSLVDVLATASTWVGKNGSGLEWTALKLVRFEPPPAPAGKGANAGA